MSTCDDGEEMRLEAGAGTHILLHEDHETSFSRRREQATATSSETSD